MTKILTHYLSMLARLKILLQYLSSRAPYHYMIKILMHYLSMHAPL